MTRTFRAAILFTSVVSIGCGGAAENAGDSDEAAETENPATTTSDGDAQCVAGQSIACVCPDGSMSAQACLQDGTGFGECECDNADDDTGAAESTSDDGPGPGSTTDAAGTTDGGSGDTGVEIPTFEDVVFVLQQSCGSTLSECHRREAFGADMDEGCRGWAAFENDAIGSQFYAGPDQGMPTGCPDMDLLTRLLDLNSWQCGPGNPGPGLPLVVPGDPSSSYIMMKIDGDVCMIAGEPSLVMPPPESAMVLSDEGRALLEAWIAVGAPGPM